MAMKSYTLVGHEGVEETEFVFTVEAEDAKQAVQRGIKLIRDQIESGDDKECTTIFAVFEGAHENLMTPEIEEVLDVGYSG